ncbi:MAG: hypothetical protein ACK5C8_03655 [Roseiflexaceae bacterium]|nr:hypothetical protein [Chloroflexaceae bacterium]
MSDIFPQHNQRHLLLVVAIFAGLLWTVGGMARWGVSFVLLLVVPAWWLQRLLPLQTTSRMVRWMVGATVGPSLVVLLYIWAAATQLRVPAELLVWVLWGASALMLWRMWQQCTDTLHPRVSWWGSVAIVLVASSVAWTRIMQVATLIFPPWVDAVHHALLIRVAFEQGRAPWDLTPYLPVTRLTFHSGYHSIMAFLMHMSGMTVTDIPSMLLYGGQILNVLAILSVAGMAWVWWRNWAAFATAMLVAGLISIMPAFYLSWSRYTLLIGMVLLPVALVALEALWRDTRGRDWLWYIMPIIALSVTHMAVFGMVLAWALVCMIVYGLPRRHTWYAAGVALLVTLPWWLFVLAQTRGGAGASAMHVVGNATQNAFSDGLFWARNNRWLVPVFVCAAAWGVRWRVTRMASLVLWVIVVALLANPWLLQLPYISFFTNETVTTAMYVPLALGIAWLAGWMAQRLRGQAWVVALVIIGLTLANVESIQHVVRDDTILVTHADRDALTWINATLPRDAVIATNSTGWMWRVDRGSDGGWWALPLTGRMVTTPPVLYTYGDDAWVAQVSATTHETSTMDGSAAQVVAFVQNHPEVTHIYASERGVMKPSVLQGQAAVQALYTSGDVTIYAVVR